MQRVDRLGKICQKKVSFGGKKPCPMPTRNVVLTDRHEKLIADLPASGC
jgi:hypothetical protein